MIMREFVYECIDLGSIYSMIKIIYLVGSFFFPFFLTYFLGETRKGNPQILLRK